MDKHSKLMIIITGIIALQIVKVVIKYLYKYEITHTRQKK